MKKIFSILLLWLGITLGFAQQYPIRLIPVMLPPYSLKLGEYATSTDNKLQLQVLMTDLQQPSHQVAIKFFLEGGTTNTPIASSAPFIQGYNPFTLLPGQQITLSNVDLRSLFALDNLSGIDPLSYSKALPDGVYSFCFQAYDWFTKNNLSQKACAIAFFNQYEPPFLTLPQNGERIPALSPYDNGAAAMIFQWQPRQIAPNTRYVFTLKELWDLERDPISGFLAAPPFWQEEVFSPTLFYGLDKAQLIPGKRYAWQVQAKSGNPVYSASPTEDNGTYKNNGLSEIFYFDYTENCKTPSLLTAQNAGRGKVKIQWMLNGASAGDYNVQYRKRGTTGEWITAKSYQSPYFITGLEDLTEYEYRVGSVCGNLQNFNSDAYAYSAIQYFTTDSKDKSNENFQCGIMPAIDISNKTIYQGALGVNDVIIAGDFPVTITQANGIGNYSGEGYIIVPYLGDTKLKVSFNNIQINTDKKLIAGTIETTYDPSEKAVIERSDLTDAIAQIFNDLGGIVTDVYKDIKGGVEATIIVDNFIKTFLENIDDIPNILEEDKQKLKEGISSPEFREKLVQVVKEKREDIAKNGITEEEFKDVFKTSFTEATNNVSVDIDEKSSVSKTEIAIGFDSDNYVAKFNSNFENQNYRIYLSPAGRLVILPKEVIPSFSKELTNKVDDLHIPDGALTGFILGEQYYVAYFTKSDKWKFEGYKTCIKVSKDGNCSNVKFYTDINGQLKDIEEKLQKQDTSVLNILGVQNFSQIPLLVGIGGYSTQVYTSGTAIFGNIALESALTEAGTLAKGARAVGIVEALPAIMVWIFVTPSTIEIVGTGDVVPTLPLNITPTNDFLKDIPKDLPITIPHSYPRNRGNCKVYVIWSVSPSGKIDVAKYGMTCTGDYEDQCNMRPESQCKKFIAEDTKGYKYYYNWVTRDISKEMCHIIEKSLTASYVITNGGRLPTQHYLPCFNKKDDFEREGRAKKWIEEMIKQYGK